MPFLGFVRPALLSPRPALRTLHRLGPLRPPACGRRRLVHRRVPHALLEHRARLRSPLNPLAECRRCAYDRAPLQRVLAPSKPAMRNTGAEQLALRAFARDNSTGSSNVIEAQFTHDNDKLKAKAYGKILFV